jgi:hypothetical protein
VASGKGGGETDADLDVLVLVNGSSAGYFEWRMFLEPYLDHFGVPRRVIDLSQEGVPADCGAHPLIIAGHSGIAPAPDGLARIRRAVRTGTGLVSFDPGFLSPAPDGYRAAESVAFPDRPHYVTARHDPGEVIPCLSPLAVPELPAGQSLVTAGDRPLVTTDRLGHGRIIRWATIRWAYSGTLGPVAGLDDVLWRSLVWAARKPFILRGLPPLVGMRVDDVAGRGGLWNRTPFYWVKEAVRLGFKPWLGLFIYNLAPDAIRELRPLVLKGRIETFPHAFGRRPVGGNRDFPWYRRAVPLHGGKEDDFIFYDHYHGRPWPDTETVRRMRAVDRWYAAHAPFPRSRYFLPHWYEANDAAVCYAVDRWGAALTGTPKPLEPPHVVAPPWIRGGPFRLHEPPGDSSTYGKWDNRGGRPVYYADFVELAGRRMFNCLTEIRDVAGYEWRPDNDITGSIDRGVRQLNRAIDSMALAVLFTHETDHIWKIEPENFRGGLAGVANGIANRNPIQVTMEEGVQYVRATKTSRLESARLDGGRVTARFSGRADVPTHFHLFTERKCRIMKKLVPVRPFSGQLAIRATSS